MKRFVCKSSAIMVAVVMVFGYVPSVEAQAESMVGREMITIAESGSDNQEQPDNGANEASNDFYYDYDTSVYIPIHVMLPDRDSWQSLRSASSALLASMTNLVHHKIARERLLNFMELLRNIDVAEPTQNEDE